MAPGPAGLDATTAPANIQQVSSSRFFLLLFLFFLTIGLLILPLRHSHVGDMNGSALSGSLHALAKMQAKWHLIGDDAKFKSDLFAQVEETIHEMDAFTVTNMIW